MKKKLRFALAGAWLLPALTLAIATVSRGAEPAATAGQSATAEPRAATGQLQTVEYWAGNEPKALEPVQAAPAGAKLLGLAELPLILKEPVAVRVGDKTYTLDQEGLYRFRERGSNKVARQTILYRGDAWRLAGHLSRLYVYGTRHQADSSKWDERARNGEPVSLQCGAIAVFVITHLTQQGTPARMAQCFTGSNWNKFDDGHVMMEIRDPVEKRWVLFDATLGTRYRKDGRWLNLLDMTQLYRAGGRPDHVEFVNASSKIDPLTDYERLYGGYFTDKEQAAAHLDNFRRELNNDSDAIHKWYTRIMQVPLMATAFVASSDAEDALIRSIRGFEKLERLTPSQFRARFYPEG